MVECWTDGATEGHNGKLGTVSHVGLGVYCPDLGISYSERCEGISNNEAEFLALIRAMEMLLARGVRQAKFYLDSNIVVRRAQGKRPKGRKNQNERMDQFQNIVLGLSEEFMETEFVWIPRELNDVADELSKECIGKPRYEWWTQEKIPPFMRKGVYCETN